MLACKEGERNMYKTMGRTVNRRNKLTCSIHQFGHRKVFGLVVLEQRRPVIRSKSSASKGISRLDSKPLARHLTDNYLNQSLGKQRKD